MRQRAVAGAAAAALALAPSALGHGSVRPTVAGPGAVQEFTFLVLNARQTDMVGFRLELPPEATTADVTERPPWTAATSGNRVEWRGGSVPARGSTSFALGVRMPAGEGTVSFTGREIYDDLVGPPFQLDVVLAGGARSDGDGIGAVEVFVALGVAALLTALGLVVLRRRRV